MKPLAKAVADARALLATEAPSSQALTRARIALGQACDGDPSPAVRALLRKLAEARQAADRREGLDSLGRPRPRRSPPHFRGPDDDGPGHPAPKEAA